MARTESPWRLRSREVIQATLATLPVGTPLPEIRRALRAAYPFGERKYTPYRLWCSEVKKALQASKPPAIELVHVLLGPDGVLCDWCKDEGCLGCAERRAAYARMPKLDELRTLLAASLATARGESLARKALADWYEEHGLEVEVRWVREEWDSKKATRLLRVRQEG